MKPGWVVRRDLWICVGLIAASFVVYGSVHQHDFLVYDDAQYVTENPHVRAGLTWRGTVWAFTTGYASNWHPLTWLSHMVDCQLHGLNAGAHHLTNVLLHTINAILLFRLFHRMTGALWRSAVVAGLFLVHPLHVQSVAWVAERKDVLSGLLWMLTLHAYVRYVSRPRPARYLVVFLSLALGLMAKPMLVTLPFVLLLVDFWPLGRAVWIRSKTGLGRTSSADGWRAVNSDPLWHLLREKLPLFALSIASSVVTFMVQQRGGAVVRLDVIPLASRMANALVAYVAYIGKMIWPIHLAIVYPHSALSTWQVVGAALVLIGISALVIWTARRWPYLPVGWLWYVGTLVPVVGLVQVGSESMADRYTYIPLIGLFVIVAWGTPDLLSRWRYRSPVLAVAAGLVLSACMIAARSQVNLWKDSATLFEHTLTVTRANHVAHYTLGVALSRQGRTSEAIAEFTEALRISPDYASAHNDLGFALARQGRVDAAIAEYEAAVRINPDYAEARYNLANQLFTLGKTQEAMAQYAEAIRIRPDFAEAHNNLGAALVKQGRAGEGISHFTEALRIDPDYDAARRNLGFGLPRQ